jgi:hypothetical protein
MSKTETTADPPRSADPEGGQLKQLLAKLREQEAAVAARSDAILAALERLHTDVAALARTQAETRTSVETATRGFLSLQAIVVNALPSRLLRLTQDHVTLLREKAPSAKVRLISAFKSGLINLREGETLDVMDNRVRVHGSAMDLALVVSVDSDVDVIVQRLVDEQVQELARLEEAKLRAETQAHLASIEAQAAELRARAG